MDTCVTVQLARWATKLAAIDFICMYALILVTADEYMSKYIMLTEWSVVSVCEQHT